MKKWEGTYAMNTIDCCGCMLCVNKCRFNAIEIVKDKKGFSVPVIDENKCTGCNQCKNICPHNTGNIPLETYAAYNNNEQILLKSSSGGIFSALADYFIKEGGYVAGCIFDNEFQVKHVLSNKNEDISKMRGSKYVQSSVGYIYKEIKEKLDNGNMVLFTGTPCQNQALKTFLGKEYDSLLLVDFICHGVSNEDLWGDYLNYEAKRLKGKITDFRFRDKEKNGWGVTVKIEYERGGVRKEKHYATRECSYFYYFLTDKILRDSCYGCSFSSDKRISDITMGDYWGRTDNVMFNKGGVSCVLANTQKGFEYIKRVEKNLTIEKSDYETIKAGNRALREETANRNTDNIYCEMWKEKGYSYIEKKFLPIKVKYRIKKYIKKIVRKTK